jgi:hypothetical protein
MNMKPESLRGTSGSSPYGPSVELLDSQLAFAKVVGQALADTWRSQCQAQIGKSGDSSQQDARPKFKH